MQNPNPSLSKHSTSSQNPRSEKSKSSMEEETSLKTALEVLVEFSAGDNDTGRGGGEGRRIDENGERVSEGQAFKKRKNNEVKDNPSENPICPKCKSEFPTWKNAIGHMQENPNCTLIGSSSPMIFSSSHTTTNPLQLDLNRVADDGVQPMEIEGPSNTVESIDKKVQERKDLGFDLNQLPPNEEDDV